MILELTLSGLYTQKVIKASSKPGAKAKTKVFQKYLQAYVQVINSTEFVYRGYSPSEVGYLGRIYDGQMISVADLKAACVYKILVRCNNDRDVFAITLN